MLRHQPGVFFCDSRLSLRPLLRGGLLVWLCLAWLALAATAVAQQSGTQTPQELVKLLHEGGYVLYIRHAATDHTQTDRDLSDLSRCDLQRNLSEQGMQEARTMGSAITSLGIKIDEVYSSPYCRCVDTAKIAFGRYEIVEDMRATFFTNEQETRLLVAFLQKQLSKKPRAGYNTVLVGHTANLRDLTNVWPKPEGVAHVFKPLGEAGYEHLGRIVPSDWASLAAAN